MMYWPYDLTSKVYKFEWFEFDMYENRSKDGGAQAACLADRAEGEIVFERLEGGKRLWGRGKPDDFVKLLSKNLGLYELIQTFPYKAFFDIDKIGVYPDHLEYVKP